MTKPALQKLFRSGTPHSHIFSYALKMNPESTALELFASFVKTDSNGDLEFDVESMMAEAKRIAAEKKPQKRVRKPVAPEDQCCARVWANGTGSRCGNSKKPGCGCFCKKHHLQSQVADGKMFQFNEEGKHIGLFWGRYDQLNEDGSIPFTVCDENGNSSIICQWKNELNKAAVITARKNGIQFHQFSGESKTRAIRASKAKPVKKTRRTKNAYLFFLDSVRAEIRKNLTQENGIVKVTDVARVAGARWKALSDDDRAPFAQMAAEAKALVVE